MAHRMTYRNPDRGNGSVTLETQRQYHTHGAAQNRRGCLIEQITSSARRVLRPADQGGIIASSAFIAASPFRRFAPGSWILAPGSFFFS